MPLGGISKERIDYAIAHHEYKGIISYKAPSLADLENEVRFNPSLDFDERREGYKEIAREEYKRFLLWFKHLPILYNHQSNEDRPPWAPVVYPMGLTTRVELHENGTMYVYFRPFDNESGRAMVRMIEDGGPHGLSLSHLHNFREVQPREVSICFVGKRDQSGVITVIDHAAGLDPLPLTACVPVEFPPAIKVSSFPYRTAMSEKATETTEKAPAPQRVTTILAADLDKQLVAFRASNNEEVKNLLKKIDETTRPGDQALIKQIDDLWNSDKLSEGEFKARLEAPIKEMASRFSAYSEAERERASKPSPEHVSAANNLLQAFSGGAVPNGQVPAPVKELASLLTVPGQFLPTDKVTNAIKEITAVMNSASADSGTKKRKMDFTATEPETTPPDKKEKFSLLKSLMKP
jgi:hypothetical protein